jgi:hypothetical protein
LDRTERWGVEREVAEKEAEREAEEMVAAARAGGSAAS